MSVPLFSILFALYSTDLVLYAKWNHLVLLYQPYLYLPAAHNVHAAHLSLQTHRQWLVTFAPWLPILPSLQPQQHALPSLLTVLPFQETRHLISLSSLQAPRWHLLDSLPLSMPTPTTTWSKLAALMLPSLPSQVLLLMAMDKHGGMVRDQTGVLQSNSSVHTDIQDWQMLNSTPGLVISLSLIKRLATRWSRIFTFRTIQRTASAYPVAPDYFWKTSFWTTQPAMHRTTDPVDLPLHTILTDLIYQAPMTWFWRARRY